MHQLRRRESTTKRRRQPKLASAVRCCLLLLAVVALSDVQGDYWVMTCVLYASSCCRLQQLAVPV